MKYEGVGELHEEYEYDEEGRVRKYTEWVYDEEYDALCYYFEYDVNASVVRIKPTSLKHEDGSGVISTSYPTIDVIVKKTDIFGNWTERMVGQYKENRIIEYY